MTTISATTIVTGFTSEWDYENRKTVRVPVVNEVKVGDFLSETLVTDSIVWEVIKVTAKTVTVRSTKRGEAFQADTRCDKGAYGLEVMWEEQVSNPDGYTKSLRTRKDGTIRNGDHVGASPFYPTPTVDGKPARRVDYRF